MISLGWFFFSETNLAIGKLQAANLKIQKDHDDGLTQVGHQITQLQRTVQGMKSEEFAIVTVRVSLNFYLFDIPGLIRHS